MEESKILVGYDLLRTKENCKRCIPLAENAACWEDLLSVFRAARNANFLGEFETVKSAFIKHLEYTISETDKLMVEL